MVRLDDPSLHCNCELESHGVVCARESTHAAFRTVDLEESALTST